MVLPHHLWHQEFLLWEQLTIEIKLAVEILVEGLSSL